MWTCGSGGQVINLGGLPESRFGFGDSINAAGQVVGVTHDVPELSIWAMMLLGFAGLGIAGYRKTISAIS